jgi:hypothetical protein
VETVHVMQFAAIASQVTTGTKLDTGLLSRSAKKKKADEEVLFSFG